MLSVIGKDLLAPRFAVEAGQQRLQLSVDSCCLLLSLLNLLHM
jgi:hypothetical protein